MLVERMSAIQLVDLGSIIFVESYQTILKIIFTVYPAGRAAQSK